MICSCNGRNEVKPKYRFSSGRSWTSVFMSEKSDDVCQVDRSPATENVTEILLAKKTCAPESPALDSLHICRKIRASQVRRQLLRRQLAPGSSEERRLCLTKLICPNPPAFRGVASSKDSASGLWRRACS